MRDLTILSAIIIFWIFYGTFIVAIQDDSVLNSMGGFEGNQTTNYNVRPDITQGLENESTDTIVIFKETTKSKSMSFVDFLFKIITFGVSGISGLPLWIATLLVSFNYFLGLVVGLIIYRLIRHGGG